MLMDLYRSLLALLNGGVTPFRALQWKDGFHDKVMVPIGTEVGAEVFSGYELYELIPYYDVIDGARYQQGRIREAGNSRA